MMEAYYDCDLRSSTLYQKATRYFNFVFFCTFLLGNYSSTFCSTQILEAFVPNTISAAEVQLIITHLDTWEIKEILKFNHFDLVVLRARSTVDCVADVAPSRVRHDNLIQQLTRFRFHRTYA